MKILCSISVGYRQQPINKPRKPVKSTLALCKHPNSNEFCLILFNAQNKTGTKYNLKANIKQVLTKFVNEGKCTIQFKAPEHDLYITCDALQLKGFLHLLKRVLENKVSNKELTVSSMAVTAIRPKDVAPKKLIISKRSEYPTKGFPRTLEELRINGISRCSVDSGILQLRQLRILDLSSNCIEFVPEEFFILPELRELNLSHNNLHKASGRWKWMQGNLSRSLLVLDLSFNELIAVPKSLHKLQNLQRLNLSHNCLQVLPANIGSMTSLKTFDASNNNIKFLPGSIRNLRLQSVDMAHNVFKNYGASLPKSKPGVLKVRSLKEYASQVVVRVRIPYPSGSIPATLIDYLDEGSFCVCGKAIFGDALKGYYLMRLDQIAENVYSGCGDGMSIPVDGSFCSKSCYKLTMQTRMR